VAQSVFELDDLENGVGVAKFIFRTSENPPHGTLRHDDVVAESEAW
jgi:hypothetical protein